MKQDRAVDIREEDPMADGRKKGDFFVELSNIQVVEKGSNVDPHLKNAKATITILNDDIPGTLAFDADEIVTSEGTITNIGINRTRGTKGQITCRYKTFDGTALADDAYMATSGILTFEDGEPHQTIEVPIKTLQSESEEPLYFTIMLSDASPGVKFESSDSGGPPGMSTLSTLIIPANRQASLNRRIVKHFCQKEKIQAKMGEWREQFSSAFYCNGSPTDQAAAGPSDWFFSCPIVILEGALCVCAAPLLFGRLVVLLVRTWDDRRGDHSCRRHGGSTGLLHGHP
jgi:hypothetical protein